MFKFSTLETAAAVLNIIGHTNGFPCSRWSKRSSACVCITKNNKGETYENNNNYTHHKEHDIILSPHNRRHKILLCLLFH